MGLSINKEHFTEREYKAYSTRLYECLDALKQLIKKPCFGTGTKKIGAELENYIVDRQAQVMPINTTIIEQSNNPNYTVELNRFNLEINLEPECLDPTAFSRLQNQIDTHLSILQAIAEQYNSQIVPIGILPTLQHKHLTPEYMTDFARYRALSNHLYEMRGENFKVHITGEDELILTSQHVTLEGANTSFQFHLMTEPEDFANVFNAVQLTTSLVLAVAANSPVLLGKKLWDETRIALFKQSIDSRKRGIVDWRQPSRVSFGHGWIRDNAWELFAETVALYPPIFPILSDENPIAAVDQGITPKLEELNLHMGTTWPWNRAVYSHHEGGHVRIEMRALPAGPSTVDMVANAVFATGLAIGLKDKINDYLAVMPFRFAEYNFYRAAQSGLEANIVWTDPLKHQPVEMPIITVLNRMLPIAQAGLQELGVSLQEINYFLGLIQTRLDKMITGSRWQKHTLNYFERNNNREGACLDMFKYYMQQQKSKLPVTEWEFL